LKSLAWRQPTWEGEQIAVANESILIIEDEEDILELIKHTVAKEGYKVLTAMSGEQGLELARADLPDLIILDLMLPGLSGIDVCRLLKNDPKTQRLSVIILSAKGEESDIVTGLEIGADDYLTKPFSPRVLVARIRTVLRRKSQPATGLETIRVHDVVIHPGRHEVLVNDERIDLTLTQFKVLHFLASRPGWVFTRYQIVDGIREEETVVTDRSIDVQIVGLRKKLGAAGEYIETVRGVGYRFKE
jgi:two-component system phosphate regulon response regulator PhoB